MTRHHAPARRHLPQLRLLGLAPRHHAPGSGWWKAQPGGGRSALGISPEVMLAGEVADSDKVKISSRDKCADLQRQARKKRRDRPVRGAGAEAETELTKRKPNS